MSELSKLFKIFRHLDEMNIFYSLSKHQQDAILISATLIGRRIEITFFEDDHIEFSVFSGNEEVSSDDEALYTALKSQDS